MKEFQRKYSTIGTILSIINDGKNSDLPNENKKRQAYNSITTKDIRIAIKIFNPNISERKILNEAMDDKKEN